jgi:hypothetical protein
MKSFWANSDAASETTATSSQRDLSNNHENALCDPRVLDDGVVRRTPSRVRTRTRDRRLRCASHLAWTPQRSFPCTLPPAPRRTIWRCGCSSSGRPALARERAALRADGRPDVTTARRHLGADGQRSAQHAHSDGEVASDPEAMRLSQRPKLRCSRASGWP